LLLKADPDLDPQRYFSLKYGFVLGFLFSTFFRAADVNTNVAVRPLGTYDDYDEEDEEEQSGVDLPTATEDNNYTDEDERNGTQ